MILEWFPFEKIMKYCMICSVLNLSLALIVFWFICILYYYLFFRNDHVKFFCLQVIENYLKTGYSQANLDDHQNIKSFIARCLQLQVRDFFFISFNNKKKFEKDHVSLCQIITLFRYYIYLLSLVSNLNEVDCQKIFQRIKYWIW